MFSTPAHKQVDPAKLPAQRVEPARLALCAGFANGGDYVLPKFNQARAEVVAAERDARKRAVSWPDVGDVIAWENGEMAEEDAVEFFQAGIDSGRVWQLQGSYGRMAAWLIETGRCTLAIR